MVFDIKIWRKNNQERINNYYWKNKTLRQKQNKIWREKNLEEIRKKDRDYTHRPEIKIRRNKLLQEKRKNNIKFNLNQRLRDLFRKALSKYTQTGKTANSRSYGIDYKSIIEFLSPFPKDIHLYHIDHIRPLCSFNFIDENGNTDLEQIKKAFAPKNHQWLLAIENIKKGGRYEEDLRGVNNAI